MRLTACLGLPLNIIEPCGFPWDMKKIRQSGMDYTDIAHIHRHVDWRHFKTETQDKAGRVVLMTTKAELPYTAFEFRPGDRLLAGRESAGVPDDVYREADAQIRIPMQKTARSLNVVNASAMILGEALRQLAKP